MEVRMAVNPNDTCESIGKRLGVKVKQLSGYPASAVLDLESAILPALLVQDGEIVDGIMPVAWKQIKDFVPNKPFFATDTSVPGKIDELRQRVANLEKLIAFFIER